MSRGVRSPATGGERSRPSSGERGRRGGDSGATVSGDRGATVSGDRVATVIAGSRPALATVKLGELQASDRAALADIVRATGVFSEAEVSIALELFDETFCATASSIGRMDDACGYRFIGAFGAADELLGYACFGATPGTEGTWDVYWIAVDPALHGGGIGTALMEEVERRLQAERARLVVVETSSRSDYEPTRRFYERLGYVEGARVRDFYAPSDDRIILIKRFHQPRAGGERDHHE